MKWFKYYIDDEVKKEVLRDHGFKGLGQYMIFLEIVTREYKPDDKKIELPMDKVRKELGFYHQSKFISFISSLKIRWEIEPNLEQNLLSIFLDKFLKIKGRCRKIGYAIDVKSVANVTSKKKKKASKKKTTKKPVQRVESAPTWDAYRKAFFNRYGTEPIRNAKVNANLSQFVKRVGVDLAPEVAEFYVNHNLTWYAKNMHSVGIMLANAEKLASEMQSGLNLNDNQIKQHTNKAYLQDVFDRIDRGEL